MTKLIFVTGGVVSGIGKGIVAASCGNILSRLGYNVSILKCDPYINIDPGTLNPKQHGEVFVTRDGAETDLDLGHYERFIMSPMTKLNSITTGQIYDSVIKNERAGNYKGATVQIFHIVEEIKRRIHILSSELGLDFLIVEIGGTVGDMESIPFLEAVQQIVTEEDKDDTCCIHVTYVPYLHNVQEYKTKPSQHSVRYLREAGITPNILITRAESSLDSTILTKLSKRCYVKREHVIDCPDSNSLYYIPEQLKLNGLKSSLKDILNFSKDDLNPAWYNSINTLSQIKQFDRSVALVGKYTTLKDSYISVTEALKHAANKVGVNLGIDYYDVTDKHYFLNVAEYDGVIIPGGFGDNGIEELIEVITYCREMKVPLFGICLGMQLMCIEFARNFLGYIDANSIEFDPHTEFPIIDVMPDYDLYTIGGTLRRGSYPTCILAESISSEAYNDQIVYERHRHRYEFNNSFRGEFLKNGFIVSGYSPDKSLVEIVELKHHPWYLGCQFHPEFESNLLSPHPLFISFLEAVKKQVNP